MAVSTFHLQDSTRGRSSAGLKIKKQYPEIHLSLIEILSWEKLWPDRSDRNERLGQSLAPALGSAPGANRTPFRIHSNADNESRIPASAWNGTVSWRRRRPLSCWVWKHPLCRLHCGRIKFKGKISSVKERYRVPRKCVPWEPEIWRACQKRLPEES